jgi:hypothetical protein
VHAGRPSKPRAVRLHLRDGRGGAYLSLIYKVVSALLPDIHSFLITVGLTVLARSEPQRALCPGKLT